MCGVVHSVASLLYVVAVICTQFSITVVSSALVEVVTIQSLVIVHWLVYGTTTLVGNKNGGGKLLCTYSVIAVQRRVIVCNVLIFG